jgi:hypothetical protein
MKRLLMLVIGFALAVVLPPSIASASDRGFGEGPSVFGGYVDPWASWGVSRGGVEHRRSWGVPHHPRVPRHVVPPHRYPARVWVAPFWYWNGAAWMLVPGHWAWAH